MVKFAEYEYQYYDFFLQTSKYFVVPVVSIMILLILLIKLNIKRLRDITSSEINNSYCVITLRIL